MRRLFVSRCQCKYSEDSAGRNSPNSRTKCAPMLILRAIHIYLFGLGISNWQSREKGKEICNSVLLETHTYFFRGLRVSSHGVKIREVQSCGLTPLSSNKNKQCLFVGFKLAVKRKRKKSARVYVGQSRPTYSKLQGE